MAKTLESLIADIETKEYKKRKKNRRIRTIDNNHYLRKHNERAERKKARIRQSGNVNKKYKKKHMKRLVGLLVR